jgi:hypothetical protein
VTERPINRKQNKEQQEKEYSWKKKRHTMKNLIISSENKLILWLSRTEVWKKHDYKILEESGFMWALLKHVIRVDLWFLWIVWDYSKHDIMIPYKNSKLKKITATQKEENRFIAWIRVLIENVIGRAKKYWIIANKYRNRTTWDFRTVKNNMKQKIMLVVCWLYNLNQSKHLFA